MDENLEKSTHYQSQTKGRRIKIANETKSDGLDVSLKSPTFIESIYVYAGGGGGGHQLLILVHKNMIYSVDLVSWKIVEDIIFSSLSLSLELGSVD